MRFKDDKEEVNNHKDCWCLVKNVEKQMIEHESPFFASAEKRKVFQNKPTAPPVGHYETSKGGLMKGSFNSRFKKKAENQEKRRNVMQNRMAYVNTSPNKYFGQPNMRSS